MPVEPIKSPDITTNTSDTTKSEFTPELEKTKVKGPIVELIDAAVAKNASDIHLVAGVKPTIRIDGKDTDINVSAIIEIVIDKDGQTFSLTY